MDVLVAMSGGVDSSVTAYLLKQKGYNVSGISFVMFEARGRASSTSCCSISSINDARFTSDFIGINHKTLDLRDEFIALVMNPFIEAYKNGLTPNPCILCNRHIKFPYLLKEADAISAELIATGHYARVVDGRLLKGLDSRKDQSYVLYGLRKEELNRLILPLGDMTKDVVRRIAADSGLPISGRPESQEICFVGDENYTDFISSFIPDNPGTVLDQNGNVVGAHHGIHRYTIGQRKGLGIAFKEPIYITGIDAEKNIVHVGPRRLAYKNEFYVSIVNWLIPKERDFRATVKVRSMMKDEPATVHVIDYDKVKVVYDSPEFAPAPGQSAVFYEGDAVVGGGEIAD